jgi:hypothetical protein
MQATNFLRIYSTISIEQFVLPTLSSPKAKWLYIVLKALDPFDSIVTEVHLRQTL